MAFVAMAVGVSSALGAGLSYKASKDASDSQDRATDAAIKASEEQLAFQKQQYQDWQDIYGPIQDNLADFYQNYDAEYVTTLGLQNIEKEYSTSKNALVQEMTQRGLDTSGLTAASLTQLEGAKASEKASVRAGAELQAAQAKQSFLGVGMGQESRIQQGISNAYGNLTNTYGNQITAYGNQAAAAAEGFSDSLGAIGTGIAMYNRSNSGGEKPYVPPTTSGQISKPKPILG